MEILFEDLIKISNNESSLTQISFKTVQRVAFERLETNLKMLFNRNALVLFSVQSFALWKLPLM